MCSQTRPAPPRIIVCFTHNVQTCSSDHTFCTSSDLTVHHATPQRSTRHSHHSHTPATYSHTCMNPTAELMRVESSGGSTKVGGSTTADDTPAYPTPLPIFVPVSFFQDDNSNPLDVLAVNCHTAILGKSGGGKTHLACHLDHAVGTDQGVEPRVGCRHHASAGT